MESSRAEVGTVDLWSFPVDARPAGSPRGSPVRGRYLLTFLLWGVMWNALLDKLKVGKSEPWGWQQACPWPLKSNLLRRKAEKLQNHTIAQWPALAWYA